MTTKDVSDSMDYDNPHNDHYHYKKQFKKNSKLVSKKISKPKSFYSDPLLLISIIALLIYTIVMIWVVVI